MTTRHGGEWLYVCTLALIVYEVIAAKVHSLAIRNLWDVSLKRILAYKSINIVTDLLAQLHSWLQQKTQR